MHYVILGTAGHIDHGKSALVKALTGIDPDRLKEEKERGITIDLGFADLQYPEHSLTVGIVDVPGHERLVRNMLAGAGGIDMVLLVIAADEGIMPQTKEHLYICDLLNIKAGIIAITKTDLVQPEWLQLVKDEVRDFVKGTFLESSEILPVSSKTGYNLNLLKEKIKESALKVKPKPTKGLFRLPIDRVFTLKGFGTVVTGTALSGSISIEDTVELLPSCLNSKARGIQSHGKPVKTAYAGQRVAINLQGIDKTELKRGDTLVEPNRFIPTTLIDVSLELLKDAPLVKNRALFHFHTGTSETIARCILYGREELSSGQSCYCQMRLDDPVVVQSGDRYILRRSSPQITIGGGEILDTSPLKRKKKEGIEDLRVFEHGSLHEKIALKIKKAGGGGMKKTAIEGWIKAEIPSISDSISSLKEQGRLIRFEDILMHKDAFNSYKTSLIKRLTDFHKSNPLKQGMPKEEVRAFLRLDIKIFNISISLIDEIQAEKDSISLKGFSIEVSPEDKKIVLDALDKGQFLPPFKADLASMLSVDEKKVGDILKHLERQGVIVRINDSLYLSQSSYQKMIDLLKKFFREKPEMTVAEFRDLLGTTRKYAVPFLEYLDSNKITLRVGDIRKSLLK
ncbi:MAG: selenocysteine-specific translation elongation factor [Nitrospirae bacterium]|nr:selenocysteine-specific translation elongation factor [Nitrospirota bacterium]